MTFRLRLTAVVLASAAAAPASAFAATAGPSPVPAPTAVATAAPTDAATPAVTNAPVPTDAATSAATTSASTPTDVPVTDARLVIGAITCSGSCPWTTGFVPGGRQYAIAGTAAGLPDGAAVTVYVSVAGAPWARVSTVAVSQGAWSAPGLVAPAAGAYRWMVAADGTTTGHTLTAAASSADTTAELAPAAVAVARSGAVTRALSRVLVRALPTPPPTPVTPPKVPAPPKPPAPPVIAAPKVTLTAPATVIATATSRTMTGRVVAAAPTRVRIQRLVGGTWADLATVTPDASGAYSWSTGLGTNTLDGLVLRAVATDAAGRVGTSATASSARVLPADQVRLSDGQARSILASRGIPIWSSGHCSTRSRTSCTSLDTMTTGVVRELVTLKAASGCSMTVSGGTEVGHATGQYSHYSGYKADLLMTSCLTGYIRSHARFIGGSKWLRVPTTYFNEGSHWDLTVKS